MKRRIRQNAWGNWKGYEGRRKVEDFGTDELDAILWRDNPQGWADLKAAQKQVWERFRSGKNL